MNLKNQTKMHILTANFIIIILVFIKWLCTAAITAGIAGVAASESEKGLGTTINDTIIHAAITESMFKKDVNKFLGVKSVLMMV